MAHLTTVYNLQLNEKEINFLYNLLGCHIIGTGDTRETSNNIHAAINQTLNKGSIRLNTDSRAFIALTD